MMELIRQIRCYHSIIELSAPGSLFNSLTIILNLFLSSGLGNYSLNSPVYYGPDRLKSNQCK